ncbi:MAG: hypothetical protein NTX86_03565 [Candidatus Dependentiae bacterium]|nr:hypothetical protein [Candidatus Dependentiae bacterium]
MVYTYKKIFLATLTTIFLSPYILKAMDEPFLDSSSITLSDDENESENIGHSLLPEQEMNVIRPGAGAAATAHQSSNNTLRTIHNNSYIPPQLRVEEKHTENSLQAMTHAHPIEPQQHLGEAHADYMLNAPFSDVSSAPSTDHPIINYVHGVLQNTSARHERAMQMERILTRQHIDISNTILEARIKEVNEAVIELQRRRRKAGTAACIASLGAQMVTGGFSLAITQAAPWCACNVICPISAGVPLAIGASACYYIQQKKMDTIIQKLATPTATPDRLSMQ